MDWHRLGEAILATAFAFFVLGIACATLYIICMIVVPVIMEYSLIFILIIAIIISVIGFYILLGGSEDGGKEEN